MPAPLVQIQDVRKTYRSDSGAGLRALDHLTLDIHSGEFLALIGPTGCGKTTLLNIIAGLDTPDAGAVLLGDGLRQGVDIPCVFQHYTLFPWRTLLRNATFGLEMRGIPKKERNETARALLDRVGLNGFEHAYPHELSGGMRQRAAIAQALASHPKLLLMDEPFGAVDDATRMDLQKVIAQLWKEQGLTVLFVTHNIDEAIALGDRVVVFAARPGRVVEDLAVSLPRPRDRVSPEFTELFVHIRQAVNAGDAPAAQSPAGTKGSYP